MKKEQCVLIVTMEAPASHEDEFNDWYDTEHFPQRCGLPGFTSGSRWVCLDGWPRWMALYDLDSIAALDTDAYHAVSGPNATPWSRRLLPRTLGRERVVAQAADSTSALPLEQTGVARLLLACYTLDGQDGSLELAGGVRDALLASLSGQPHLRETRVYFEQRNGRINVWAVSLFSAPVLAADLARTSASAAGVGASVFNLYSPYYRSAGY
jgi:hypothetical protein